MCFEVKAAVALEPALQNQEKEEEKTARIPIETTFSEAGGNNQSMRHSFF